MKRNTLISAASALVSVAGALTLEKRDSPAVLSIPFERQRVENAASRRLKKRAGTETLQLDFNSDAIVYTAALDIGQPPQRVNVQLDTASSELIVETMSSNICKANAPLCLEYGVYEPTNSSTYTYLASNLAVLYAGGTRATGTYATDSLAFGDVKLDNFTFGIMLNTTVPQGVLGVGYEENEFQTLFPNFPRALLNAGYIATRAFSVWFNDRNGPTGTFLFGGVDTAKYYGDLVTMDLSPNSGGGNPQEFFVPLLGIDMIGPAGGNMTLLGSEVPRKALLDTGTTQAQLPTVVVEAIWAALGVSFPAGDTTPYVKCSVAQKSFAIVYKFEGIEIHNPISQFLLAPQGDLCQLLIIPNDITINVGDPFFGSAYVVYDLDQYQISLAQAVLNTQESNIIQIMPGLMPKRPGVADPSLKAAAASSASATVDATYTPALSSSASTALSPSLVRVISLVVLFAAFPWLWSGLIMQQ